MVVRAAFGAESDDFEGFVDALRPTDDPQADAARSRFPSFMTVEYHPELAEAAESE